MNSFNIYQTIYLHFFNRKNPLFKFINQNSYEKQKFNELALITSYKGSEGNDQNNNVQF